MKIQVNEIIPNRYGLHGFRKAFIKNTDLSPEARLLLIILMSFKGKNINCWPSLKTLSKSLGRNTDSVAKYLKELKSAGYLKVKSRGIGRSNSYTPSYFKLSSGINTNRNDEFKKASEELPHQPTESTLSRSIYSGNIDRGLIKGKELFDKRRKELGL